jgi:peptidoglycan/xylan/chitin deacetylase (PgdA/CDA1 family)
MLAMSKYRNDIKLFLLTFIFTLLTISIVKNAAEISAVSSMNPTINLPIMMYHQVKNSGLGKDVISPYEFESDLKYLQDNNYTTITMTELIDYVYYGKKLPKKPIILTFDDGYYSTYKYVFPLIKKYNVKIVLSIVGKSTDDFTKVTDTNINYAHISWDQVKEMQESGLVEIQNHTYNLHRVCNGRYSCEQKVNETLSNYEKILVEDTIALQNKIEQAISVVPNTFTYPYGRYNENTEKIIKQLGFRATLTVKYGINLINRNDTDHLFGLRRICRSHNESIGKLIKEGIDSIDDFVY